MVNPFARGAGIAAIVLVVLSGLFLIALNGQRESAADYDLMAQQSAILSWWATLTFLLAVLAFALWTLLRGIQWIAARIAPGAFTKPAAPDTGISEAEASSRLGGTEPDSARAD